MAQMAGRASVEFYVGLALKVKSQMRAREVVHEAFVIRTFRNGLSVFVSSWVLLFFSPGESIMLKAYIPVVLGLRGLLPSNMSASTTPIYIP